ncbi:beta-1,3-galactosyltransferase 2-like isoform X1 [Cheilinus undulatus]|uniref:beta-1,3-galactosyltransferase 2-like isoform X1 n=1 Tax=Cheilinus undulatus TaxID=241271 RepID=UPI001BD21A26|nr:beta-1,3-galactosyltransferase 2-like isoform X1 [Cheilinus undulatus]
MSIQKVPTEAAAQPAGLAVAPAHVMSLTRRPFFVSTPRFRNLSEGHQKKPIFQSWFQFLLLFCFLLFILCYTVSQSTPSWWDSLPLHQHYHRFFNRTRQIVLPPPFFRVKPQEILKTTAVPAIVTSTKTSTKAPIIAPTKPPTEPPTKAPTVPTAVTPPWPQYHQAYPRNYHFIMDKPEVCRNQTPFLVLMIPVAPGNIAARDAIRQTWGKEKKVQGEVVLTLFMLGLSGGANIEQQQQKLKEEDLEHHDLIQSDFMDTYKNLTIKTMVIMDWLATRCPTAAYAMKVDSDMFLNIDNLVIMLQRPGIPRLNYLTGMLMWNRPVLRSKNSKWYVPEEMYPEPRYPTYTLGMGYVFSNDLPEKFVNVSKSIKPFNIEDAYIGMCMKKLGLNPSSPPNPSQFQAYNSKYNRCSFSKVITYILGSSKQLIDFWTDLKKPGPPCP